MTIVHIHSDPQKLQLPSSPSPQICHSNRSLLRQSIPTLDIVFFLLHDILACTLGVLLEYSSEADLLQTGLHLLTPRALPALECGGSVNLEAKDFGLVAPDRLLRDQGRVNLEENVLKRGAKVSAIDVGVAAGFWVVQVLAFTTIELDGLCMWVIGEASW